MRSIKPVSFVRTNFLSCDEKRAGGLRFSNNMSIEWLLCGVYTYVKPNGVWRRTYAHATEVHKRQFNILIETFAMARLMGVHVEHAASASTSTRLGVCHCSRFACARAISHVIKCDECGARARTRAGVIGEPSVVLWPNVTAFVHTAGKRNIMLALAAQ